MMFVLHHLNDILELLMEPGKNNMQQNICGLCSLLNCFISSGKQSVNVNK